MITHERLLDYAAAAAVVVVAAVVALQVDTFDSCTTIVLAEIDTDL